MAGTGGGQVIADTARQSDNPFFRSPSSAAVGAIVRMSGGLVRTRSQPSRGWPDLVQRAAGAATKLNDHPIITQTQSLYW